MPETAANAFRMCIEFIALQLQARSLLIEQTITNEPLQKKRPEAAKQAAVAEIGRLSWRPLQEAVGRYRKRASVTGGRHEKQAAVT